MAYCNARALEAWKGADFRDQTALSAFCLGGL